MAKIKPNQRKVAPSYYKHRKVKKKVKSAYRWVAGRKKKKSKKRRIGSAVTHKVCVAVPDGFDLKLVKKGGIGKRRKRR